MYKTIKLNLEKNLIGVHVSKIESLAKSLCEDISNMDSKDDIICDFCNEVHSENVVKICFNCQSENNI